MKKILSISLGLLLLVSTIGVTVHRHYCSSILIATSILPQGGEDACGPDMPMEDDSCSDEHEQYNVDSPRVLLAMSFDLSPSIEWVRATEVLFANLYTNDFTPPKFYTEISPPLSEPSIYTKVQSFLL